MSSVSTLRLTLLRASYLLLVVGIVTKFWPTLVGDVALMPRMEGVVTALLSALGLLWIIGIFSPLRMLPLLLFEITWKVIWVLAVALPNWRGGTLDEGLAETLFAVSFAIPLVFIVPWRYVARTYFATAESAGPASPATSAIAGATPHGSEISGARRGS
jgi:hypothetical protein